MRSSKSWTEGGGGILCSQEYPISCDFDNKFLTLGQALHHRLIKTEKAVVGTAKQLQLTALSSSIVATHHGIDK